MLEYFADRLGRFLGKRPETPRKHFPACPEEMRSGRALVEAQGHP